MSVEVITKSVCDRCEDEDESDNPSGDIPSYWATVTIRTANSNISINGMHLCHNCASDVLRYLKQMPERVEPVSV